MELLARKLLSTQKLTTYEASLFDDQKEMAVEMLSSFAYAVYCYNGMSMRN